MEHATHEINLPTTSQPARVSIALDSRYNIAMKTLDQPVFDRPLDPLGRILTPEVAPKLVNLRFDATAQARLDKLARKCNEGEPTDDERREYKLVDRFGAATVRA
jgi:hypothetical protein